MLSRQFAQLTGGHKKAPPIDSASDSEGEDNKTKAGSALSIKKKKKKGNFQPPAAGKITFDFNGKVLTVKDPNFVNIKTVNPQVRIIGQN